ncbi:putative fad binding domain-containing protein [Phaeomoniella chlamydospora]|uniref:Putative fad binding domain-containing protein n=1 Tax=Phaeomoniella chlamydospora TaxID=158046 RepID=A0A0G2F4F8_PHACM|nr:putative fad binding domain-containing protein [Phaeomoniella chlamydospora]
MPIPNAANINSTGVLIAASGLTSIQLSTSRESVTIGPGNRWGDIYEYLEPYDLIVVGGRLGVVGVPGFMLGGGISFFGNQYGWASSNVISYECVLASGQIINATSSNEYSDLFWALRGGGNSFCLVTAFELKTYEKSSLYLGDTSYGTDISEEFLDHVYHFAHNGSQDNKAAVIPLVNWYSYAPTSLSFSAMRFYDGNDSTPAAFTNFTAPVMTPTSDTFHRRSMYDWVSEFDIEFALAEGLRQRFYVLSLPADRLAMGIIHDTYFETIKNLSNSTGFVIAGVAYMPISESYIRSGIELAGQDPMGVDPSKAPYIWVEQSLTWTSTADDAAVIAFIKRVNNLIKIKLDAINFDSSPYLYLNDANSDQKVFEGYPDCNVQKLKQIRAKYDSQNIFTDLMPGGWKVEHTVSGLDTTVGCAE